MAIYSTGGDTTNLWNAPRLVVLRNKELLNKESFTIHADTSFRRHDQFILTFTPVFMKEVKEDYDINLNAGLGILYKNGKHIGTTRSINRNETVQLTLKASDEEDIQSVVGFLYYRGKKSVRNFCLVDNITLVRMHEREVEATATKDSTEIDTVIAKTDTIAPFERRMTPEEIRLQNKSGKHIKIQSVPSVRTPNSIGTRRRKKKN